MKPVNRFVGMLLAAVIALPLVTGALFVRKARLESRIGHPITWRQFLGL